MTIEQLIAAVNIARLTADATASSDEQPLPNEVIDWHGYGTRPMTIFLNTLCKQFRTGCRYVEFGSFAGRSLLAAAYHNRGTYIGVDNHSWLGQGAKRFASRADLLAKLSEAVKLASLPGENIVSVRTMDTAAVGRTTFMSEQHTCDVFMYDGDHAAGPTRDGIVVMAKTLRPGILIMDDYASSKWKEVPAGTVAGLEKSGLVVHEHWRLPYHTGVGVWVVDQPIEPSSNG